ncbi:type II toxin-antitoxin system RelE family toxin [Brunnivagina elsteri]|uniref:Type II toxin-antitoxin system mRNA interferase toxin, RelE/StbE family n=1 Tax=Brunnivagina elsteri CCALA 953 TaxID=987040 RepID=A0A2A2TQR5_9CYAN|nr:type II toxin-antitoxin system RelE/ParE family toxin [Calothrix elsteri]PAX60704.1 type II toxin-antitoxin system mRNA interferase toxin, RelE/StbE family [Calothrix elsteri CCALA 953]
MSYEVEITPAARRQIKKLPNDIQKQVVEQLEELAFEPRPDGVKKLAGSDDLYRVRLGKYRIIYEIQDGLLLITVVKVKNRSDVYKS